MQFESHQLIHINNDVLNFFSKDDLQINMFKINMFIF
jgi:hypothetical protein